jgi:hypothetical protein
MKLIVGTPCPKSWDEMAGNDRVRYCSQCNLNVYNLAVIPRSQVRALIRKKEGRFCGRLYLRGDRLASTRDCPEGQERILIRRIVTTAAVLLIAAFGWVCHSQAGPDRNQFPPWAKAVMDYVDPPMEIRIDGGCSLTGVIVIPQRSPAPTTPFAQE